MTGHRLIGLSGTAEIKITGACPEDFLTRITAQGVRFRHYRKEDELTALLTISAAQLEDAKRAAAKTMCTLELLHTAGAVPSLRGMKQRLLVPGILLLLIWAVFLLQGHIWFFQVEGNDTIPEERILRVLEECGVGFFSKTDKLDMNTLKNQVLSKMPELGWITVNTRGGVATVVVRERAEKPASVQNVAPANVVARKSGLITDVTVTGGSPAVQKGDLVTTGQLLISGVTDLDKTVLMTRAEGEVYARTWAYLQGILPVSVQKKVYTGAEKRLFSITLGKKTLNLWKSSGISYGEYDKIIDKKPLTLPGGYTLPLSLTVTRVREYRTSEETMTEEQAAERLEEAALAQLSGTLTAGQILSHNFSVAQTDTVFSLSGMAECREEIGAVIEIKN